jgi:hypothetical protein
VAAAAQLQGELIQWDPSIHAWLEECGRAKIISDRPDRRARPPHRPSPLLPNGGFAGQAWVVANGLAEERGADGGQRRLEFYVHVARSDRGRLFPEGDGKGAVGLCKAHGRENMTT